MGVNGTGVLDPIHHARIIEEIELVSSIAGIAQKWVIYSARPYCTDKELDWLKHFHAHRENGMAGLVLHGPQIDNSLQSIAPDSKLMAITGALVRNFIDARLMPLNTILDTAEAGDALEPTVILVPNLFIESAGKSLPSWRVQVLYDILLGRLSANKPSVLYVENWDQLQGVYGTAFSQHLTQHYTKLP